MRTRTDARTHGQTWKHARIHLRARARVRVLAHVRVDPPCVRACARMCPRVGRSNPPWRTRHFLLCRCRIRGFPKDTSGNQTERARQVKGNPARKKLGASERGCFPFYRYVVARAYACARVCVRACGRVCRRARARDKILVGKQNNLIRSLITSNSRDCLLFGARARAHVRAHTRAHARTYARTRRQFHTHARTGMLARAHAHVHTHAYIHTHTHTGGSSAQCISPAQ
jgi:hypothetical protein